MLECSSHISESKNRKLKLLIYKKQWREFNRISGNKTDMLNAESPLEEETRKFKSENEKK